MSPGRQYVSVRRPYPAVREATISRLQEFSELEDTPMVLRYGSAGRHDDCCSAGSSAASTRASISAAFAAEPDLDYSAIVVHSLGPIVILEGYIASRDQREVAIRIAETVVGTGKVQDHMLSRFSATN